MRHRFLLIIAAAVLAIWVCFLAGRERHRSRPVAEQVAGDRASLRTGRQTTESSAPPQAHWSFNLPRRPPIPSVSNQDWVITPIDAFIAAAHETRKMAPSEEADPETLIARAWQDLLGLPPPPEEVADFVDDRSAGAWERTVDRLLASPRFGERMAVLWLDLVRYADTDGYSKDLHREVWMYRDWVIDAFNTNMSFDRFTHAQLAGDLIPYASQSEKIASGYNRVLMTSQEGCADPKEYTHRYAADRVRNLSSVWLGVTIGCAECHDHKFDPFTSRDFYSLAAYFADVKETAVGPQELTRFGTAKQEEALVRLDARIARVTFDINSLMRVALLSERQSLLRTIPACLTSTSGEARMTRVRPRGDWADDSGEVVEPSLPVCLAPDLSMRTANRLDLANWLTAPENPLVARVLVNRLWKVAFGRGLVATVDNFGVTGDLPSHPELLDWLAVELVEQGWDVKRILKLILTSRAWRQSSAIRPDLAECDPQNRWLARQNRYRLDAEFIRDHALAVSDLLSQKIGGRSVKPRQPDGYWAPRFSEKAYHEDSGSGLHRRSLYTYWCRNYLHPVLQVFDAPARISCTPERIPSSTPLQALALLNEPGFEEAAIAFATRIIREGGTSTAERVDCAFRLALGRRSDEREQEIIAALLSKQHREFAADNRVACAIVSQLAAALPADLDVADHAAWTVAAKVILNLHETITRK